MPIDGFRRAFKRAGRASASAEVNDELAYHSNRVQLATPTLMNMEAQARTLSHLAAYMGGTTVIHGADESVRQTRTA